MDDRFATEVLTEAECWDLVERTAVGRLAVCLDGRAHIFPINFVKDVDSIVFRTPSGTKLSAAETVTWHAVAGLDRVAARAA